MIDLKLLTRKIDTMNTTIPNIPCHSTVLRNLKQNAFKRYSEELDCRITSLVTYDCNLLISVVGKGILMFSVTGGKCQFIQQLHAAGNSPKCVAECQDSNITCYQLSVSAKYLIYIKDNQDKLSVCLHNYADILDGLISVKKEIEIFRQAPLVVDHELDILCIGSSAWSVSWTTHDFSKTSQETNETCLHTIDLNKMEPIKTWKVVENSVYLLHLQKTDEHNMLGIADSRTGLCVYDLRQEENDQYVCLYQVPVDEIRNFHLVAGLFAEGYSLPLAVHKSAIDDIQKRLDQWKAKLHDDSSTDDNGEAKNPKVTKSTPPGRIQEPSEISTPTKGRINKWLKKERNKINKCHITGNDIPQEIHSQSDILQSSVNKTGRNMSAKHLRCNTCDKILKTERGLVEHQEMHRSGPKTCPECGKVLHSKSSFYVHKKKHKELLKCSHCEYIAGQRSWLEQHITAVHKKEQMYLCEICAKSFSYESVLKRHIEALHSSGELICCEYCEYSTKTRQCLKRHVLNKHTPNRPKWICDLCGNIFRSKAILEDHRYLHMGEKKFKCTKCDNTFSCRSSKNRHLRTVHGEKHFPCADCGKLFNDKVYLHRHAVIHTGEKNYACGFCDYCCNTRGNLRKHWRVVHKKKDHDIRQKPVIRLFTSDMDNSHPPLDENENKNKVCGGHQYSSGAKLAGDNSVNVACTLTGNGVMTTDTTQCSYDVLQPVSKVLFTGGQKTESAEPSPSIICEPQVVLTDAEVMISVDFQQQSTLMSSHEGQILEYRTLQNWSEM